MKKTMAVFTLFAFVMNMLIMNVGAIVLCSHTDHIHFDFAKSHVLSHTHSDFPQDSKSIKANHCDDYVFIAHSLIKNISEKVESPSPKVSDAKNTFLAIYNIPLSLKASVLSYNKIHTKFSCPPQISSTPLPLII